MVASELHLSNQQEKAYMILKKGIEIENICNEQMCMLSIECIRLEQYVDVFTDDIQLISFKDEYDNTDEMLEILSGYFEKARFVFHRDKSCYMRYLKQVRYFI